MRDRRCLTRFPPTNAKRSEVFLTKEVFLIAARHCVENKYSIKTKPSKIIGNESVAIKTREPKSVMVIDYFA